MAEAVLGTWNFESGENMDNYMAAVGVPDAMREKAKTARPVLDVSKDGTAWIVKTTVGEKVVETKYPDNETVDTVSLMGQAMKATLTLLPDGIQEVQTSDGLEVTIKRSVQDGVLVSVLSTKGVEAKLTFSKA